VRGGAGADFFERLGFGEGDGAGPDAGGDHGDGEAGAFFVGPVDDACGQFGGDIVVVHGLEDFNSCVDSEDAIVSSSGWLNKSQCLY
jgi:hypothetical protein